MIALIWCFVCALFYSFMAAASIMFAVFRFKEESMGLFSINLFFVFVFCCCVKAEYTASIKAYNLYTERK